MPRLLAKDLPEDILIGIFQGIKSNPISLTEHDKARARMNGQEDLENSLFLCTITLPGSAKDSAKEKFRKNYKYKVIALTVSQGFVYSVRIATHAAKCCELEIPS